MIRIVITAAVLALTATAACADPLQPLQPRHPSVQVVYGDLNLSRPDDAAVLKARIQAAARSVCQQLSDREEHSPQMAFVVKAQIQDCVDTSAGEAMATVVRNIVNVASTAPKVASNTP